MAREARRAPRETACPEREHYSSQFDTVELNAPFYSWPTLATVATWKRQAGRRKFVYAIKVNELVTHTKRFSRAATLIKDFGLIPEGYAIRNALELERQLKITRRVR